jgi:hypothetical protein
MMFGALFSFLFFPPAESLEEEESERNCNGALEEIKAFCYTWPKEAP